MADLREHFSDEEILEGLTRDEALRRKVFKFLYRQCFDMISQLIATNGGNTDDAHDIFQEALIVFYEKVRQGKFRLSTKVSTFLYAVARHLWIDQLRKKNRERQFKGTLGEANDLDTPVQRLLTNERQRLVNELMGQLKPDCAQVLKMAVYEGASMKEISARMGYKNEQIAQNKKHRCLNYLRKLIRERPFYRDYFKKEQ